MGRGLSREASARYSFLLAIPIIAGATLVKVGDILGASAAGAHYTTGEALVGALVAAVAGYWAINYLLKLVATDDLTGFARYVVLLSILTFVGTLWIGPPSSI